MHYITRLYLRVVIFFGVLFIPCYAFSQDATAYQVNPQHNGIVTFQEPFAAPLKRLWHRNFGPSYVGIPITGGNTVFVTTIKSAKLMKDPDTVNLFALDLRTGRVLWGRKVYNFPDLAWETAASTYANGRVFVLTGDCHLTAVSASGDILWRVALPTEQYFCDTAPVAYGKRVYVAGAGVGGRAAAFDQVSGAVKWERKLLTGDGSSPTEGGPDTFLTYPCQDYKLSNAKGASEWPLNTGCVSGGGTTADYFAGRLFVLGNEFGDNEELDAASEKLIRNIPGAAWLPVFWKRKKGDYLQIQWETDGLYARDINTYQQVWMYPCCASFDYDPAIAPIVVNNFVFYGDGEGVIYMLDAATGKLIWSEQATKQPISSDPGGVGQAASLAAAHGVLLVPAATELIAFGN